MTETVAHKEYFGALDILRFFAFLCVFISHIFVFSTFQPSGEVLSFLVTYLFTQGNLGVTFFFVLSGFLITYLLLGEKNKNTTVSVPKFYMRRVLRIWPVYFMVVIVGFFCIPFFAHMSGLGSDKLNVFLQGTELYRLPWYAFFVANFDMVLNGPAAFFLAVLWSISVEEQFYAVWPWMTKKHVFKYFVHICIGLLFVSLWYRYVYAQNLTVLRAATPSFFSDLLTGALFAYVIYTYNSIKLWFQTRSKKFGYSLLVLLPISFILFKYVELKSFSSVGFIYQFTYALLPQILAVYFAIVIAYCCFNEFRQTDSYLVRKLKYLGQISYGLYCYHSFAILAVKVLFLTATFGALKNTATGLVFGAVVAFVLTVLFAHISFVYIEKPILKLKERFS